MLARVPPRLQRYLRFLGWGALGYLAGVGLLTLAKGERSLNWPLIVGWIVIGALLAAISHTASDGDGPRVSRRTPD